MRIGVIGAGSMGGILARLAKRGHHVSIANSRGPESLTALAAEFDATPVSVVDAANAGEIVIIAIPTKAVAELPPGLFANVPTNVVVVDIGNYHARRTALSLIPASFANASYFSLNSMPRSLKAI